MTETDLQALERFVAENDDLLKLEEQIGRFNIFDALGIARIEIRHSNFLAWLLTPSESHGQGDLFLKAFLMDVLRKARQQGAEPPISAVELDGADLRGVDVCREWRKIDLLISCEEPRFVVAVENKIDSGEHDDQLQRYKDTVASEFPGIKSLFVFLTPVGDDPSDEDWVSYSYAHLYQAFIRARTVNARAIGGDVAVFLDHYLNLIGNRFMENPELEKLCQQIYNNHRQALGLIMARCGSPSSELVSRIQKWMEERPGEWLFVTTKQREVEFIPAAWDKMLPPVGKPKPGKFAPEDWMKMVLRASGGDLRLYVVVRPTTDAAMRGRALLRLLKDPTEFGFSNSRRKLGETWTNILSEKVCALSEDGEPEKLDAVMERIEKRLEKFLKDTAGLPAAMKALFPV
jgi:hypothetical protein